MRSKRKLPVERRSYALVKRGGSGGAFGTDKVGVLRREKVIE